MEKVRFAVVGVGGLGKSHMIGIGNNSDLAELVAICDNREDAEQITPELLQRADRPDAFFAINDDTAIGILRMVKRSGLRVPEDVSIFGFSDGFRSLASDPQLTSVNQRGQEVGREAVDILVSEVEGILPTEKANKRVVKTEMVLRGTTKIISEE
mgnify:CR=1 FL=1